MARFGCWKGTMPNGGHSGWIVRFPLPPRTGAEARISRGKSVMTGVNGQMVSVKWKFDQGYKEVKRVGGRWGAMYIDYEHFDVGRWKCVICGYGSTIEAKTHKHISEEHSVREKLDHLAEEMGFGGESRIDRFRKVMQTMDKVDWAHQLTTAQKEEPIEEADTEPGLNARI